MATNVDVTVTANVADLTAKFAVASANANALAKTLRDTAREAAAAGRDISDELKQKLNDAATAFAGAKAKAQELNSQLKDSRGGTQSFGEGLRVMKEGLAALGIAASVEGIKAFAEAVEQNSAHIQHQADVLQLDVRAYQAFRQAAVDTGVGLDAADTAIQRFSKNAGEASVGTGTAAKSFLEMGINVNQSKEALLQQVAAFELHASVADRDRFATELFGRTGAEMIPLFKEWAQGADALATKFDGLGRLLSPETADRAEKADEALQGAWEHMKVASAGPVANLYTALAGLLNQASGAPAAADSWSQFGAGVGLALTWPFQAAHKLNEELQKLKGAPKPTFEPVNKPYVIPDHSEKAEIAALQAFDPLQKEKNDLLLQETGLRKLLKQYQDEGHEAAAAQAKVDIADIEKKLAAMNKTKFGGGYSNEGDKEITETQTKNSEIKANEKLTIKEIYDAEQANWQALLDGHRLNAKQIEEVKKQMAKDLIEFNKQTQQQADAIAKSDLQMNIELAKLALTEKRSELEEEFSAHKITAQQKFDATRDAIEKEVAAEKAAQQQIIDAVDSTVVQKHQAADQEIVLDAQKNAQIAAAAKQLTNDLKEEDRKREESWRAVDSAITGAEGTLVNDIFTKRQSLATDLAEVGVRMLEEEVANDLKALTEHELVNLGMLASDKATAQEGLLFKLFALITGTTQTTTSEAAKTAAVTTGAAARTAAEAAATAASKAAQATLNVAQAESNAAVAATGAAASQAFIPIIGPELAAAAAASTFATLQGYVALAGFAKGINVVPQDMIAQVHAGERIVPAADNRALIDAVNGGGKGGGGDVHVTYAPVFHNSAPKPLGKMLDEQSGDFVAYFQGLQRDGII